MGTPGAGVDPGTASHRRANGKDTGLRGSASSGAPDSYAACWRRSMALMASYDRPRIFGAGASAADALIGSVAPVGSKRKAAAAAAAVDAAVDAAALAAVDSGTAEAAA